MKLIFDNGESKPLVPNFVENATVTAWKARVLANAGQVPGIVTIWRLSQFCDGMDAAGLSALMLEVNALIAGPALSPLIACQTPLYRTSGGNIWVDSGAQGYVNADVSRNGLQGNGLKCLDTGFNLLAGYAAGNYGWTAYGYTNTTASRLRIMADAGHNIRHDLGNAAVGWSVLTNTWLGLNQTAVPGGFGLGYLSANYAGVALEKFGASSTFAHQLLGSVAGPDVAPPAVNWLMMGNGSGPANNCWQGIMSFCAIHQALSLAQSAAFFGLIQTLRQNLGGGYV